MRQRARPVEPPIQSTQSRTSSAHPTDTVIAVEPPAKPALRRQPRSTPLETSFRLLKATSRGKHAGLLSNYHLSLIDRVPAAATQFGSICSTLHGAAGPFNVVKLDARYRVSFLRYQRFTVAFPALLAALTCDLGTGSVRRTNYTTRRNPPILHRKELLLPAYHPLVPHTERLTDRLERLGAFRDTFCYVVSAPTREARKPRKRAKHDEGGEHVNPEANPDSAQAPRSGEDAVFRPREMSGPRPDLPH